MGSTDAAGPPGGELEELGVLEPGSVDIIIGAMTDGDIAVVVLERSPTVP